MSRFGVKSWGLLWVGVALLTISARLPAQTSETPAGDGASANSDAPAGELPDFGGLGGLSVPGLGDTGPNGSGFGGLGLGFGSEGLHLEIDAAFRLAKGTHQGVLQVRAKIEEGWHLYSITQPAGGPVRTTIHVTAEGAEVEQAGVKRSSELAPQVHVKEFTSRSDPEVLPPDVFPVPVEQHAGQISWTAPIEFDSSLDPESVKLIVRVNGQVCNDELGCVPLDDLPTVTATFGGYFDPPAVGEFRSAIAKHVTITGEIESGVVAPGNMVRVRLTATPDQGWHVYQLGSITPADLEVDSGADKPASNKPTLITLDKRSGWTGRLSASTGPSGRTGSLGYHEAPVTWTVELRVPRDAEEGPHELSGVIGYQICTEKNCLPPTAARFTAMVEVGAGGGQPVPLAFESQSYGDIAVIVAHNPLALPLNFQQLLVAIGAGLLGGLILNLMPCVLPVIGLKVLSFVEQSGQNRWTALSLNLWFSAGLISVFLGLATMAVFLNLGWGEQFTYTWFKVAMTGLVFAMALSFLGVWELPIPGFAGSQASQSLQQKEGAFGAFFKGVFTTILATPCSGPFLGALFAYSLTQPPYIVYTIFAAIGLGMSLPYLLAGAFPAAVNWLPRPGAWMETFKELLGFVLLGTMVYLMVTIKPDYRIATLTLLIGIWFACWLVGRIAFTSSPWRKLSTWGAGIGVAWAIGWGAFNFLTPYEERLEWRPYSREALAQAQAEGKTVLVDYTANWCLTCQLNLRWAIDTRRVESLVDEYDIVALKADWTDHNPLIKQSLAELNSSSIPLLAIYPAGETSEKVIVLRDLLRERTVLEALREAGPSQGAEAPGIGGEGASSTITMAQPASKPHS